MKNYNMILIERLQKYQLYHQVKYSEYEYLTGEEILPSNKKLNKLNLLILLSEKLLKNKQKQLKTKEENKLML